MDIEDLVRTHLGAAVVRVESKVVEDREGQSLLTVNVIYDGSDKELSTSAMLDLPGRLRDRVTGFPVVTYVDIREVNHRHAAE